MAIQSRCDFIRSLKDSAVSENDAISMFNWGKSDSLDVWESEDLRLFLAELSIAFDFYPVVSDEAVEAALRELQLDANDLGRISKMEWKSYFLYLLDAPLNHLLSSSFRNRSSIKSDETYPSGQTVVIRLTGANVSTLSKAAAQAAIRKATGPMKVFEWAHYHNDAAALCVYETPVVVETSLTLNSLPSLDISEIKAWHYISGAVFPDWIQSSEPFPSKSPGLVAKALASTVLFGAMVSSQAKVFDEKVGFTSTAKTAYNTTKEAVVDTDQRLGISKKNEGSCG